MVLAMVKVADTSLEKKKTAAAYSSPKVFSVVIDSVTSHMEREVAGSSPVIRLRSGVAQLVERLRY